jgi:uncharacterized membrane protein YcaP (DUF421 family)
MYLALFVMLRVFRRQTGSIGAADLLVLLLIADAAQNGMACDYKSVTDGLVLVATIVGWARRIAGAVLRMRLICSIVGKNSSELFRSCKNGSLSSQTAK